MRPTAKSTAKLAFLAPLLLLTALLTATAAAAAPTGSIVYIKDFNVWLMSPDAAINRQLTTDGTEADPYQHPSQTDAGAIFVSRGITGEQLVQLDRSGNPQGAPAQLRILNRGAEHHDVSRDGTRVLFQTSGAGQIIDPVSGNPVGVSLSSAVDVATVDGTPVDGAFVANYFWPSWVDNDTLLVDDAQNGVYVHRIGEPPPELWLSAPGCLQVINCPPGETPAFVGYAHLSPDAQQVAYSFDPTDGTEGGLRLATMDGAPPAAPTDRCLAPGLAAMQHGYQWAPDGSAIAYDGLSIRSEATGINVMSVDLDAPDCGASTAQLLVPGGVQPDWGPVAADDPGGPGPAPSPDPSPDPAPSSSPSPDPDPTPSPGPSPAGGFDRDVSTTERVDQADPTSAANDVSRIRFDDGGAAHVVLSRDDDFPDSLAGASLTAGGPLLLTDAAQLTPATGTEIARVLPPGGTVYLLGGTVAIGQAVEDELRGDGYRTRRLAGASRVETSVAVADEFRRLHPDLEHFAGLARAAGPPDNATAGWADSVTGGAVSVGLLPILVTPSDALHPAVAGWLSADAPSDTVLFGGTTALSAEVEAGVPNALRLAGAERTETAAIIARELWAQETTGLRAYLVLNGFHSQGWAFGLAAAGLASDYGTPLLMVDDDGVPQATADLASGGCEVDLLLVGSSEVISDDVEGRLDALDPC